MTAALVCGSILHTVPLPLPSRTHIPLSAAPWQLITTDLLLTALTTCLAIVTVIGGIFGMNLDNTLTLVRWWSCVFGPEPGVARNARAAPFRRRLLRPAARLPRHNLRSMGLCAHPTPNPHARREWRQTPSTLCPSRPAWARSSCSWRLSRLRGAAACSAGRDDGDTLV